MIPNSVLNIDKMRLCFTGPKSLADKLETRNLLRYRSFSLAKIAQSKVGCQFSVCLKAPKSPAGTTKDYSARENQLGILRLGNINQACPFGESQCYFWFDITNYKLYESFQGLEAQNQLKTIAQKLGLTFYKMTYIELALDTPINYLPRIASALSDGSMKVFTLGKAPDSQTEEYRGLNWEIWQSSSAVTNTALRLKNKEKTMELYCYDKRREIQVSKKDYISSADNFSADELWRYEIRLHGDALAEFLTRKNIQHTDLFPTDNLGRDFLWEMYEYYSQRLIRAKKYRGSTLSRNILQYWEFPESAFSPIISIGGLNAQLNNN